jgi:hypothetical protein
MHTNWPKLSLTRVLCKIGLFMVYAKALSVCLTYGMLSEGQTGKDVDVRRRDLIEVISQHCSGETEENSKHVGQNSVCLRGERNVTPPE